MIKNHREQMENWTQEALSQLIWTFDKTVTYTVSVNSNVTPIGLDISWLVMISVPSPVFGQPPLHTSLLVADFFPDLAEYRSHIAEAVATLEQTWNETLTLSPNGG